MTSTTETTSSVTSGRIIVQLYPQLFDLNGQTAQELVRIAQLLKSLPSHFYIFLVGGTADTRRIARELLQAQGIATPSVCTVALSSRDQAICIRSAGDLETYCQSLAEQV